MSVRDLHVTFQGPGGMGRRRNTVRAVDGVSFDVRRGEVLCLVGESGSGKTTTVRAMARLVPISSGEVRFDGARASEIRGRDLMRFRRRVQVVFQDPYDALSPRQTIGNGLLEVLRAHHLAPSRRAGLERACAILEACGLVPATDFLQRYPHELSGGQRQRVCIACAAVLEPELLIADEPVSMLDVSVRVGILRLLDELRRAQAMTVVLVTHDLSLAWAFADRVAVMYLGQVVELGPTRDVIARPAHPYTEALVSAIPIADPSRPPVQVHLRGSATAVEPGPRCRFHGRCLYGEARCGQAQPALELVGEEHHAACFRTAEIRADLAASVRTHLGQVMEPVE
jgi:peptide/nickel transport system ATP-binding protein